MPTERQRRPWRVVALTPADRFLLASVTLLGVALLAWLDSPASPWSLHVSTPLRVANVFSLIVTGIEILAGWVATAAELTATYVWVALQWLGASVATFLKSTGAMFAKVWDGLKIVWSDVLKPALVWVDDHLKRLYAWMKDTFKPVFNFLREVRCRLTDFYKTFVRPVVDTIDFIRGINQVLLAFHIDVLQGLDRYLQQLEQRIEEPILWLNAQLNKVWNALELVVTADGFFQRLTLIRSMSRYAPQWMNGFWNGQIDRSLQSGDDYSRTRDYPSDAKWANGKELGQFYRGEDNRMQARIGELVTVYRVASGIDPPDGDEG